MGQNMKKHLIALSLLGVTATLTGLSFYVLKNNQKIEKADAYTATISLPTTIDLNDNTPSQIRSYYSSLNSLSTSERQGTNLLKNLKPILKNNQTYYSYDYAPSGSSSGIVIWRLYEIIDRDWEKSPATDLTGTGGTYNSSTNKIENYVYGTSNSKYTTNPYLHSLYFNRTDASVPQAWGDHTGNEMGINREHIWAKSHGFGATDTSIDSGGARGDPMHLWSGNQYVNITPHNNNFFGFVDTSVTYTDAGNLYSHLSGNLKGTSLNLDGDEDVFEPQDCDKGDIARAIFYMAARYNNFDGDTAIDANNPNLRLVDAVTDINGTSKYDSTSSITGNMGVLRDLLAWNRLDPPDAWEIHRNNLCYNNYTNNRNPFIDFPEWAEYIWGKSTLAGDNRTITSYNSSSTGYATPSSDSISTFGGGSSVVNVTSVSVSPTSTTLNIGGTQQLTATVLPNNATDKSVSYTSNNTSVATVSNSGLITAVSSGNATITVTTTDGNHTATCQVTVNEPAPITTDYSLSPNSPYINGVPYKMFFYSTNYSANYYFTGTIDGYYGAASTSIDDGVDVYFEKNGDGQNMYFYDSAEKNYLYVLKSGTYYNFKYSTSVPSTPWYYQVSEGKYSCMTYTTNDILFTFGTYSTYETFNTINLNKYTSNYEVEFISSDDTAATALSELFLDDIVCNANGTSAPTFVSNVTWDSFEKAYDEFNDSAKNVLSSTMSNPSGTSLQKGLARYDYILGKYNTSSTTPYNDFLGRIAAGKITINAKRSVILGFNNQSLILIIIACSSMSFISFVLLMRFRKKKHY